MSVSLGELVDGLTTLQDVYGHAARVVSVDADAKLYTHRDQVLMEDLSDQQVTNMVMAGWYWNEYDGCWEIQL